MEFITKLLIISIMLITTSMPAFGQDYVTVPDFQTWSQGANSDISWAVDQINGMTNGSIPIGSLKGPEKDTITISIGNGTLAMSNVSSVNKNIEILAEGGSVAWDESGHTAARSETPESGAAADSMINNAISKTNGQQDFQSAAQNQHVSTNTTDTTTIPQNSGAQNVVRGTNVLDSNGKVIGFMPGNGPNTATQTITDDGSVAYLV